MSVNLHLARRRFRLPILVVLALLAATGLAQVSARAASLPVANSQDVPDVVEDAPTPKTITLTASDADLFAELTFLVTGGPSKGSLDVTSGPMDCPIAIPTFCSVDVDYTPDSDEAGADSFTFTVNDGLDGTSAPATVTITIAAVNDAPSFTKGGNQTVLEDAGAQSIPGWATSIDKGAPNESAQILTFVVTNNTNPGLFSAGPAVAADGTLSFTPAADAFGTATISLRLDDNGGTANGGVHQSAVQQFTITVTSVNDAPSFTKGGNQTVLEDAGAQSVPGWATNIDAGAANESGQILTFVVTDNTNTGLFSAGPAVAANGTLTYTPAADANGIATISLRLDDDGGTASGGVNQSGVQQFTITMTAVNDAPSFMAGADPGISPLILEDAGAQSIPGWATSIDKGAPNESAQILMFVVTSNTNPGLFSAGPAVAANGTLSFTPAADAFGTATISLRLDDNGGTANGGMDQSAVQQFTITVTSVNDAPSFTKGPDPVVLEDAGAQVFAAWGSNFSTGPPNESAQTLSFTVQGNTNPGLFSVAPVLSAITGNLSFTPAPNANGSSIVTFRLRDSGGFANGGQRDFFAVVTITVTPVNDAPSFTKGANQTVAEDSGPRIVGGWATVISAGPANEAGQTQTFVVTANTNPGLFSAGPAVSSGGILTFTPKANANGAATISIRLRDNGGTANGGSNQSAVQSFTITVTPVNDPPNAINDVFFSIQSGAPPTPLDVLGNDTSAPDGPETLTIVAVTQGTTGAVAITGGGAGLTYEPAFDFAGNDAFTYTIEDPGGLRDTATVLISVVPGATYVPIDPVRSLDTRVNNGISGALFTGVQRSWQVAGRQGIPSSAIAVTGNLTVTGQTSHGFVSLTPTATTSNTTSTLNFPRGDNRANGVFVSLGPDGRLHAIFQGQAASRTHLIFDVTGYFVGTEDGATFISIQPRRSLDTRVGNGLSGAFQHGISRNWKVAGRTGVPTEAIAVTGNVTVTGQTGAGFVSLTPAAVVNPTTSTINFPLGDTRANNVTVPLSATGRLHAIYRGSPGSQAHVIFDVTGYFVPDGTGTKFVPLDPERILDSRVGTGLAGTFKVDVTRSLQVLGRGGVPADAVSVTGNVTVTQQTRSGYVSVTTLPTNPSTTSTLNFPVGDNRANGLVIRTSGGKIALVYRAVAGATTHLIFDVTGYFY